MIKKASAWLLVGLGCAILAQDKAGKKDEVFARIDESAEVFQQIMSAPDKAIPQELLERAECVIIVPGMKRAGFIVGGRYGKGVATCRTRAVVGAIYRAY
jgi:SH3 domain-containing YSC84-like protein 1